MSISEVASAMSSYSKCQPHQRARRRAELCKAISSCPLAGLKTADGQEILDDYFESSDISNPDALLFAPSRVRIYASKHVEMCGEVCRYHHRHRLETCRVCRAMLRTVSERG